MPFFFPELTPRASRALAVAVLAVGMVPVAHAALQARDLDGNAATAEAFYDTDRNITWLADANYAQTSGYDADGYMTWDDSKTWAAQLNINGTMGWRLPTMVDTGKPGCDFGYSNTDCGYNPSTSTSELAHLYFVTLHNKLYRIGDQPDFTWTNTGPFSNVKLGGYWFDVEYAPDTTRAWEFFGGFQDDDVKGFDRAAWAVHSGSVGGAAVAVAVVPEPQTFALMALGLAAVLVARGRRQA